MTEQEDMRSNIWKEVIPVGDKKCEVMGEVKWVNFKNLKVNALNPNVMDASVFKNLGENIKRYGYNEYIVCAPDIMDEGKFLVIDGAHRLLALIEKGYSEGEVFVVDGLPDIAIFQGAFTYNKPRGKLDVEKTTKLFLFGIQIYGEDLAKRWSGLGKPKWDEFVRLYKSGKVKTSKMVSQLKKTSSQAVKSLMVSGKRPLQATPVQKFGRFILVSLAPDDFDFVKKILRHYDKDDAVAIVMLCKDVAKEKGWS